METVDTIRKLLALATNNPSEEEAKSAALKAAQMLVEYSVPIGTAQAVTPKGVPLTREEEGELKDTLSALSRAKNPDEFTPSTFAQNFDIDDGFMKKRIIEAWRQIREHRKALEIAINTYERETHRKFPRD